MDILKTDDDESAALVKIRAGDSTAYKTLYDANVVPLYRFLKQFRKSDSDVHELVQRTFIKAYEGLPAFSGRSTFKTWLFQIALNEMRSDLRRGSIIPFVDTDRADESADSNDGEMLAWNLTLRRLFEQLDETKRAVFILYEVEGYSHAEIAEMLNVGESTSRTILARTKQWLRSQLNEKTRIL
ncbi:MAG: RNA polymerase sigma factor [Bacteroidota bacterium]|jgi:RNA polymerase sigma-70 factor (ECF subfamily)